MKPFTRKSALLTLVLTLVYTVSAAGQEFWEKKPYQKWSDKEVAKLLTDSPWAKSYSFSEIYITPLTTPPTAPSARPNTVGIIGGTGPDPLGRNDSGRARQGRPELRYQAQFRSALPIRQALVRQNQIIAKYDDLTPDQKTAFDKSAEAFLARTFSDTLILYVTYITNVQIDDRELAAYWQRQTMDTLKNSVFLIVPGGEKVPLSEFGLAKGGREFQFVFPRTIDGKPLFTSSDKSLQLEFIHPKVREQKESRVLIAFKTDKMMKDGAPVF